MDAHDPTEEEVGIVVGLAHRLLSHELSQNDVDVVHRQLGRFPRGMLAVGARCACGRPVAVITRPLLPGGIPFPTTCYLTGPSAVKAASHREAAGDMRELTARLETDEDLRVGYERADRLYKAFRHEIALMVGDGEDHVAAVSAGGMPTRVKCLHALVAQSLVMGPGVNPIGDLALESMRDEFDPTVCRCPRLAGD